MVIKHQYLFQQGRKIKLRLPRRLSYGFLKMDSKQDLIETELQRLRTDVDDIKQSLAKLVNKLENDVDTNPSTSQDIKAQHTTFSNPAFAPEDIAITSLSDAQGNADIQNSSKLDASLKYDTKHIEGL